MNHTETCSVCGRKEQVACVAAYSSQTRESEGRAALAKRGWFFFRLVDGALCGHCRDEVDEARSATTDAQAVPTIARSS